MTDSAATTPDTGPESITVGELLRLNAAADEAADRKDDAELAIFAHKAAQIRLTQIGRELERRYALRGNDRITREGLIERGPVDGAEGSAP